MTTVLTALPRIKAAEVAMPESMYELYKNPRIPGAIKKLMPYVLIDNSPETADVIFNKLAAAFKV
jgi:hypothetical protein